MSMSDASNGEEFEPKQSEQTTSDSSTSDDDGVRRETLERGLFMILFGIIGYFAIWAVMLLAVIQWVVVMVSKEANQDIKNFSSNLAEYLAQIARYLGFATDEKPCPFAPFPRVGKDDA